MKNVIGHARYWVSGTLAAFAGVLVARVIAPHAAPSLRVFLTLGGQLLALGGLLVLCVGVSRRVRSSSESPQN